MKITTSWSFDSGEFGGVLSKGDYDKYYAVGIDNINEVLNGAGIPTNAKITSVKLTATVRARNKTSSLGSNPQLKITYGTSSGANGNVLLSTVQIGSNTMDASITRTVDLSDIIGNNGNSPFQLNTSKGDYVVYNVWLNNVGIKQYNLYDFYLDVAYTIPSYTITVGNGTVNGAPSGTFEAGTSVTLVPIAPTGYEFTEWSDGNTDNPRVVVVTGDQSYVARFKKSGPPFAEDTLVDGVLYVGTDTTNIEGEAGYATNEEITSVVIPEGRTYIGKYCFDACPNLTNITLPSNFQKIEQYALRDTSITDIHYNGTKAQWDNVVLINNSFSILSTVTVHCTDGVVEYCEIGFSAAPLAGYKSCLYGSKTYVNGHHVYVKNSTVTISVEANEGYRFTRFNFTSSKVSTTSNPYTFTVTQDDWVSISFAISKLYAGTSQAKAIYVGNKPAKAIYIGTTKIYEQ